MKSFPPWFRHRLSGSPIHGGKAAFFEALPVVSDGQSSCSCASQKFQQRIVLLKEATLLRTSCASRPPSVRPRRALRHPAPFGVALSTEESFLFLGRGMKWKSRRHVSSQHPSLASVRHTSTNGFSFIRTRFPTGSPKSCTVAVRI